MHRSFKFERMSNVRDRIWLIGLAALLLLCAACGNKASSVSLRKTTGDVLVSNEEGNDITPKENLKLYSGYRVGTEPVSYAWIDLDKVKLVKMDESSEIEIQKEGKHLELLVNSGNLFFNVSEPLADDETMNIRTSTMIVGIRGTCGWVVDNGEKGSRVYVLEGQVEAEALDTGETVSVPAGEMAQVTVTEDGETQIEVQPFAEEYVAPFVLSELEEDADLSASVLSASGLDVLNPPDPVERLKAEYDQIIARQPLFDYVNEGLCYADYIDFENDGIPELFLIQLAPSNQDGEWGYSMQLYGEELGHVKQYDTKDMFGPYLESMYDWDERGIWLSRSGDRIYIHVCDNMGQNGFNRFYSIENGTVTEVDNIAAVHWSAYEEDYYSFDNAVTAEEFYAIGEKYTDENKILANGPRPMTNRGILPELPPESQRRIGFLDVLGDSRVKYAKLIDINEDDIEDLLTIQTVSRPGADSSTSFIVYIGDGPSTQEYILAQRCPQFSESYMSWNAKGVYREKSTSKIYMRYLLIDPLYSPSSHVFESLSDYQEYTYYMGREEAINERQYEPETEEEWAEIYEIAEASEREKQKIDVEIDSRFESIEDIDLMDETNYYDTINEVRQQLTAR